MPRLSHKSYLARHRDLKAVWQRLPDLFSVLTPNAYWDLHEYFQPTKDLAEKALRVHRQQITRKHPSLPHRAGKAYLFMYRCYVVAHRLSKEDRSRFNRVLAQLSRQPKAVVETGTRAGTIEVTARFRPEIDYHKLSRALLLFMEQELATRGVKRTQGRQTRDVP